MKLSIIAIVIALFVGLLGVLGVTAIWGLSTYNTQSTLLVNYNMKVKDNQNEYDNVWKKISQVCQIADSKKDAFKEIFTGYAAARTTEGSGKVMNWIKENAPTGIDLKVYDNAQNIIVAARDSFVMRQKELIAIAEIYNINMATQPRGFVLKLFGFVVLDPKIVTSTRTENAFETGRDDDVSLYQKAPAATPAPKLEK